MEILSSQFSVLASCSIHHSHDGLFGAQYNQRVSNHPYALQARICLAQHDLRGPEKGAFVGPEIDAVLLIVLAAVFCKFAESIGYLHRLAAIQYGVLEDLHQQ